MTDIQAHSTKAPAPWLLWLGGPVLWCAYFSAAYVVGEAVCSPKLLVSTRADVIQIVTGAITLAAALSALLSAYFAWRAIRRWRVALRTIEPDEADYPHRDPIIGAGRLDSYREFMFNTGAWLSAFFGLTTLMMGLPLLVLNLC